MIVSQGAVPHSRSLIQEIVMKALLFAILVFASAAVMGCRGEAEIGESATNISVAR